MHNENYTPHLIAGLLLTLALIVLLGVALVGEQARLEEAADAQARESALNGRLLYSEHCASCHGSLGQGGAGTALNDRRLLENTSDERLFANIAAGRPNSVMPAWGQAHGGLFTDEQMRDLVTFIRAWEQTATEVIAEEYVPSAGRGAALYGASCFICHGEEGRGGSGPGGAAAINDPERLKLLDDEWYHQVITNGRPAKGMPTWGTVLSGNQIEDLVALIAAWREGEQVAPETSVAELLNSAFYAASQDDAEDATFYLERARQIAFGPALARIDPILADLQAGRVEAARLALDSLGSEWPLGDAVNGEQVYRDACQTCHGADGEGDVGLQLQPNEFIQERSNAELYQFLLLGRAGTAMRGYHGQLSESQLADVIAFLRGWQDR